MKFMQIIDQQADHIDIYYHSKNNQLQKKTVYQSLTEVVFSLAKKTPLDALTEKRVFFLDERFFLFYRFDIQLSSSRAFSISDLRKIVHEKITLLKERDTVTSPLVMHTVQNMVVNKEASDFLFGHKGDISFSLQLSLLQADGVAICLLMWGERVFKHPQIAIYPRNFFLLQHLSRQIKKEHYAFLCVYEESTELLLVKSWWYEHIHYLNMGIQVLKSCYQEQDVEKYFYAEQREVTKNPFLAKLIDEAMSFFTDNLCQWLHQYVPVSHDIIVVGEVTQNPSFLSIFQDSYKAFGSGYILPFSFTKQQKKSSMIVSTAPHISAFLMRK